MTPLILKRILLRSGLGNLNDSEQLCRSNRQVLLCHCAGINERRQIPFACFKRSLAHPPAKQLMAQPNAIGVDHVCLTVVRDLSYPPFAEVSLDIGAG